MLRRRKDAARPESPTTGPATADAPVAGPPTARVWFDPEAADVSITPPNGEPRPGIDGEAVPSGAVVAVGPGGGARLEHGAGAVTRLDGGAACVAGDDGVEVRTGATWHRVPTGAQPLAVRTPGAQLAVAGASLAAFVERGGGTIAVCLEGAAQCAPHQGEPVTVQAGHAVEVSPAGVAGPIQAAAPGELEADPWIAGNLDLDAAAQPPPEEHVPPPQRRAGGRPFQWAALGASLALLVAAAPWLLRSDEGAARRRPAAGIEPPQATQPAAPAQYRLAERLCIQDQAGTITATGTVTNVGPSPARFQITVQFTDASGGVGGTARADAGPVAPQATVAWEAGAVVAGLAPGRAFACRVGPVEARPG